MSTEPLLLPEYAASLQAQRQETITVILCVRDEVSRIIQV